MKRLGLIVLVVAVALTLAACAAGHNSAAGTGANVAGFWQGLWHGFILFFTFFISLFNHNVGIYEVHNNGGWYDFGFLLGVMTFWSSGAGGAARRSRRK